MYKIIISFIIALIIAQNLSASSSPISGYERVIQKDNSILYTQSKGNFLFTIKKIIDTQNISQGGKVDNYDDPYIQDIMKTQTPFKTLKGGKKTIHIAFRNEANKNNFLEEFGLDIFKKQNLTINLFMMDTSKLTLPLNLEVYPLFVIENRYIQGVISKKLLVGLIEQSNYDTQAKQLSLKELKTILKEKYGKSMENLNIHYNKKIELFEVYEKKKNSLNSYISKDGRYILVF